VDGARAEGGHREGRTVSRPDADPVAAWIAATVQRCLIMDPARRPDPPETPEGVRGASAHRLDAVTTGVTVTMAGVGVRYFLVRVAEYDHR
jgi:hypothetical protein